MAPPVVVRRCALPVVVLVVLGLQAIPLPPPAEAAVPGIAGKVAYDAEGSIWVLDLATADSTRITNVSGSGFVDDSEPAWSPDGTRIAFVNRVNVAGHEHQEIALVDADGSGGTYLTKTEGRDESHPAWSPDGSQVAYDDGADLWIVDVATGFRTYLTEGVMPAWSPDGSRIAFVRYSAPSRDLYVVTLATGDVRRLTETDSFREANPAWSPDGSRIVFQRDFMGASANNAILSVAPDGQDPRSEVVFTTGEHQWAFDPVWSPSGAHLLVLVQRESAVDLRAYSSTSVFVELTNTPSTWENNPDWHGLNLPPDVVGDVASVAQGGAVSGDVVANDTDPEGTPLTVEVVAGPAHGSVTLDAAGGFTYVHDGSATTSDSFTYRARDKGGGTAEGAVSITISVVSPPEPEPVAHSTGLVDPATGEWYLRRADGTWSSFYFGDPGDYPIMGDWDCDGTETPGLYRQSDGYVYLRNSNTQGVADIRFYFGNPSDIPLAGDFNGDGCDTVSIYRPAESRVFIINELGANDGGLGAAEFDYYFGNPGDKPFCGDFDGDGIETVGLHRESTGFVYFRQSHTQGVADAEFFYGDPGDRIIAGDWGVADGIFTMGLFRGSTVTTYLRYTNTAGPADSSYVYGEAAWLPVAGVFGM